MRGLQKSIVYLIILLPFAVHVLVSPAGGLECTAHLGCQVIGLVPDVAPVCRRRFALRQSDEDDALADVAAELYGGSAAGAFDPASVGA